jgi:hypothetical protein
MLMGTVVAGGSVRVTGTVIFVIRALILVSVITSRALRVRSGYFDGLMVHGAIAQLTYNLLGVEAATCEQRNERHKRAESPSDPHASGTS